MARAFLFGYQRERYARWTRLSPLGQVLWGVKKALFAALVTAILSGVYLWSTHEAVVRAVVDGTASPLSLLVPVVTSLPVFFVVAAVSLVVVLIPSRREWEHY